MTPDEVKALIVQKAKAAGIDPLHALTVASIETGGTFDPNSTNGHHQGLYAFGKDEWNQYGGGADWRDPNAQIDAFVNYQGDINKQLKANGIANPTGAQQYLGWQQGAGGASSLINNPDKPAAAVIGNAAFSANGGSGPMTSSQFGSQWGNTYNQHLAKVGGFDPAATAGTAATVAADPNVDPLAAQGDVAAQAAASAAGPASLDGGFDWGKAVAGVGKALSPMGGGGGAGAGLLAAGQPQQSQPQGVPVQAHMPQVQGGLLNPFAAQQQADAQLELKRRQQLGLLG